MMTRVLYDADATHDRRCGECTLCCKLLPVRELEKGANERCKHQRHGQGCRVYHSPALPTSCKLWSCRWLLEQDTADLSRPDRSHYVIDVMPDHITIVENATGKETHIEVVQIWLDKNYPDAHRDPALRAYLLRRAEQGVAALVRYGEREAVHLFAPPFSADGQWHEVKGDNIERHYSLVETARALAEQAAKRGRT
jgi:hypothetical protein